MCSKLLKVEDVAELLGIKTQTVYLYVTQKRIPFIRMSGRLIRFREADIENWIKGKSHDVKSNDNGSSSRNSGDLN